MECRGRQGAAAAPSSSSDLGHRSCPIGHRRKRMFSGPSVRAASARSVLAGPRSSFLDLSAAAHIRPCGTVRRRSVPRDMADLGAKLLGAHPVARARRQRPRIGVTELADRPQQAAETGIGNGAAGALAKAAVEFIGRDALGDEVVDRSATTRVTLLIRSRHHLRSRRPRRGVLRCSFRRGIGFWRHRGTNGHSSTGHCRLVKHIRSF